MDTIKVRKDELLKILKANRDKHRAVFEDAQVAFRERAIEELDRRLADAKRGRKIRLTISLPEPEDHTPDYDRVIRMIELTVDDTIGLDEQDAATYVMDQWSWRRAWAANTASYTAYAADYTS